MRPKDALVSKYISSYYFHSSDSADFRKKFFFYPNYRHAITIYKGSDVLFNDEGSFVNPSTVNKIGIYYSINTDKNFKVELTGIFNKIGIVFNPLGINHFTNCALSESFIPPFGNFSHFGESFNEVLGLAFNEADAENKSALLDSFFRARYRPFEEPVVKAAVKEILESNGAVKVEELSLKTGVNRKTLLRLFKKHLCCSVEEYKKMVMFRNALNYSQQAGEGITLTDVALYSLYYDQAHFIKHFKAVTTQSPKELLSTLTRLGQETYWKFED